MARGTTTTSHVTTLPAARQPRTENLLTSLSSCTEPAERSRITAQIVEVNLGLCEALANRYLNRGVDRDDLVQVARTALLYAIRRYQPGADRSFVAFAVPTITGELKRYFRDHCWMIRPPRRLQETRARMATTAHDLEQRLGRRATTAEVAAELNLQPSLVREAAQTDASYRPWSLDTPIDHDSGTTFGDTLAHDDGTDTVLDRLSLQRALSSLSRREQQVLKWRYVDELTQAEIGKRLGVSQMQVSRILRQSLERARGFFDDQPLAG